jgi:hypothetical protein
LGVDPILKPCRLGLKRTISYHLRRDVTYGIKAIVQPEMGVCAQAHRGCTSKDAGSQEGVIVTSHIMYWVWNMLSLNGIRPFGGRPNTKTVRAWPKVDNIISFKAECYNAYHHPKFICFHQISQISRLFKVLTIDNSNIYIYIYLNKKKKRRNGSLLMISKQPNNIMRY